MESFLLQIWSVETRILGLVHFNCPNVQEKTGQHYFLKHFLSSTLQLSWTFQSYAGSQCLQRVDFFLLKTVLHI